MKIAIVGSGISGLAVAHTLRDRADLTLLEAGSYFGGHTHTVDVTLPTPQGPVTHGVDTGFLVFNERTYPNLIQLFSDLGVATTKSDMSFSVQVPGALNGRKLEWSGSTLGTVFAQRSIHPAEVLPDYLLDRGAATAARRMVAEADELAAGLTDVWGDLPYGRRILDEIGTSFVNYQLVAQREAELRSELSVGAGTVATVPYFSEDIGDLAGLLALGERLWR